MDKDLKDLAIDLHSNSSMLWSECYDLAEKLIPLGYSRHPKQEGLVKLDKKELEDFLSERIDPLTPLSVDYLVAMIVSRFGKVTLDEKCPKCNNNHPHGTCSDFGGYLSKFNEEKVRKLLWDHVVFESGDDYKLAKAIVSAARKGELS